MNEINGTVVENEVVINLSGRIDSNNAPSVEAEILQFIGPHRALPLVLDVAGLSYISSAGLRILLHLRKTHHDMRIVNVNSDVYEILDMTGFTQMIDVVKAYRQVSVEGCEEIGRGANGIIYRIDRDNVVKVYRNADALAEIQHEREVARLALVLGIPTAISYDVVKVGDTYGSVFELLNASSFSKILVDSPDKMDWCVNEFATMLKRIHNTLVPRGKLPDMRAKVLDWAQFVRGYLPAEAGDKLVALIEAVPYDDHMIHGDYHTKNLELQGDEVLIIDMDTLSVGHPIFELGCTYNSFIGFSEYDPETVLRFQGFDLQTSQTFWRKFLAVYLGTDDPDVLREVQDKARVVGYTRLIRRSIRRGGLDDPHEKAELDLWTKNLVALLDKVDTLEFLSNVLEIEADGANLPTVLDFIDRHLTSAGCSPKIKMQLSIAAEEIFVNIANYAYKPGRGLASVKVEVADDPLVVTITFMDNGNPFDPTQASDPDVSLTAEERNEGGLGIFMTKQMMDDVSYTYEGGKNILRLKKGVK